MRLQIHIAIDPKETTPEEVAEIRRQAVEGISLSVRNAAREQTPDDGGRLAPNVPNMKEKWRVDETGNLHAKVVNSAKYAQYLLHGNHSIESDGYIHPKGDHPFRFRRRDTGQIVYAWKVRPIDPENISRTVPMPYSFRRDVIEHAMRHGSLHALDVMSGREEWRGVLRVRLTQL